MDLTIDEMRSDVAVTPSRGGTGADPGSPAAPAQDTVRLMAMLRPLVLQIVREELEEYARIHG